MPAIKAIYQMEREFHPYLQVEFLPNNTEREGIILQTKQGNIRKFYTFNNPNDIDNLRKLIWKYLNQDYPIRDIYDKDSGTYDLRKTSRSTVIDTYRQAKQQKINNCNSYAPITDRYKNNINNFAGFKHQSYNLNKDYDVDRSLCKKIRSMQCDHNFPSNSHANALCKLETEYYCNKRYPIKPLDKSKPSKKMIVSTYPHVPKHPGYFQYVVNLLNYVVYILVKP
jgi:hypothetical protein